MHDMIENICITPNITTELFLKETRLNLLPQSIFLWFLQSCPLLVLLLAFTSSPFGFSSKSLNRAILQEHGLCHRPFFLRVLSWSSCCNLKASKNYLQMIPKSQALVAFQLPTTFLHSNASALNAQTKLKKTCSN